MEWLLAIGNHVGGGASYKERVQLKVGVFIQCADNPLGVENVPKKYLKAYQEDPDIGFGDIIP